MSGISEGLRSSRQSGLSAPLVVEASAFLRASVSSVSPTRSCSRAATALSLFERSLMGCGLSTFGRRPAGAR